MVCKSIMFFTFDVGIDVLLCRDDSDAWCLFLALRIKMQCVVDKVSLLNRYPFSP